VVVIHERLKRYLVTELAIDSRRVSVIRNWCHLDDPLSLSLGVAPRCADSWVGDDVTVVLHAGNMGAKQALGNVIEASRLAGQRDEPVLRAYGLR
jgi:putative colanic acid biosynthesis glycosyltransferase WcaI